MTVEKEEKLVWEIYRQTMGFPPSWLHLYIETCGREIEEVRT